MVENHNGRMPISSMGYFPLPAIACAGHVRGMRNVWKSRMETAMDDRGFNMKTLSKAAGLGETAVRDMLKRDRVPSLDNFMAIAKVLDRPVGWLVGEEAQTPSHLPKSEADRVEVLEYDVRPSAGPGAIVDEENVRDRWAFSRRYLDGLGLSGHRLVVLEVMGDSMEPTLRSGDRVLVDMTDTQLAREGVFVLWDSSATVVKRVENVPYSDPAKVKLISDNPHHNQYEVPAELVICIGRVVWVARRL